MKKCILLFLLLSTLLSAIGCSESKGNPSTQKENSELKAQFSDDYPLFWAHNRYDKDDYDTIYSYNFKGDLIEQADKSMFISGYYAPNGLAAAKDESTGLWGYVDKNGAYQIEPIYLGAGPFSKNGIALVEKAIGDVGDCVEKYGYINSKGEEIISCIYDSATSFFDCGYAIAKKYDYIYDEEGTAVKSNDTCYIIDEKGNVVAKKESTNGFDDICAVFDGYYISFSTLYDFSGKELYNMMENIEEGKYLFKKDGVYRNKIGKEENAVVEKFNGKEFVRVKELEYKCYSKHVSNTKSGNGYGVEVDGKVVIPFEYDKIICYENYFVAVKVGTPNNLGVQEVETIDIYDKNYKKTAENFSCVYVDESLTDFGRKCILPDGYFRIGVRADKYDPGELLYGVIDYTGKVIVEPVHKEGVYLYTYEGTGNYYGIIGN